MRQQITGRLAPWTAGLVVAGLVVAGPALAAAEGEAKVGPPPDSVAAQLSYVHQKEVFVSKGRAAGLRAGLTGEVRLRRGHTRSLKLEACAQSSCVGQLLPPPPKTLARLPRPGDSVRFKFAERAVATKPKPIARPALLERRRFLKRAAYPLVAYRGAARSRPAPRRALGLSVVARSQLWQSFESSNRDTRTGIESLRISLHGSPDQQGRFGIDVEAEASYQPSAPAQSTFRPGRAAWVELRQAEFSYGQGKGAYLRAGRLSYGAGAALTELTDGVELGYRGVEDSDTVVSLRAGFRADPLTLAARLNQPALELRASGNTKTEGWSLGWGVYGAYLPGLGAGIEEGALAGGRLGLLYGRARSHLDLSLFALADGTGSYQPLLEHASLGLDYNTPSGSVLSLGLRMLGRVLWPSERLRMPSGYASFGSHTEGDLAWSGPSVSAGHFVPRIAAGFVAANDGLSPAGWGSVGLVRFQARKLIERVDFGYRIELGWSHAHLLQAAATLHLTRLLRLQLRQELGVRLQIASRQILPTAGTQLDLDWSLTETLGLQLNLMATYGFTGNGLIGGLALRWHPELGGA